MPNNQSLHLNSPTPPPVAPQPVVASNQVATVKPVIPQAQPALTSPVPPVVAQSPVQTTATLAAPAGKTTAVMPPAPPVAPAAPLTNKVVPPTNLPPRPGMLISPAGKTPLQPTPIGQQNPKINLPKGGPGAPNPVAAKVSKSPLLKFLPFIVGAIVILAVAIFAISKFLGGNGSTTKTTTPSQTTQPTTKTQPVELVYWGLFEDAKVMQSLIDEFQAQNKNVTIRYVKQSHVDYRERLQAEIASGNGPDIFRFHASWTPMLKTELAGLPATVMNLSTYNETFYPIAGTLLQSNGQLVGIPLMYDQLALFYNKKMLTTANATPPTNWRDLQNLAKSLTVGSGNAIQRGGLAIGNAENVEHFADILGLLILQNGGDPAQPNTREVKDALTYYISFAQNNPVYSTNLPSSTVAFAREEVAMMLAPSWRAHDVIALNPNLEFGVVASPKLADKNIAWASFWAEGVSAKSKNQVVAWQFLKFLSSKEALKKLYSAAKQTRAFGEIYPRIDMADELASDPYVPAFLENTDQAKSWYLCSYTHDNGLNDKNIAYYQDAVNALLAGKQMDEVIETLEIGIKQNLGQYNLKVNSSTPTSSGGSVTQ